MTNFENIKNMTKSEMAEFLRNYFTCEYECASRCEDCYANCEKTINDWLDKECEQNEHRSNV